MPVEISHIISFGNDLAECRSIQYFCIIIQITSHALQVTYVYFHKRNRLNQLLFSFFKTYKSVLVKSMHHSSILSGGKVENALVTSWMVTVYAHIYLYAPNCTSRSSPNISVSHNLPPPPPPHPPALPVGPELSLRCCR